MLLPRRSAEPPPDRVLPPRADAARAPPTRMDEVENPFFSRCCGRDTAGGGGGALARALSGPAPRATRAAGRRTPPPSNLLAHKAPRARRPREAFTGAARAACMRALRPHSHIGRECLQFDRVPVRLAQPVHCRRSPPATRQGSDDRTPPPRPPRRNYVRTRRLLGRHVHPDRRRGQLSRQLRLAPLRVAQLPLGRGRVALGRQQRDELVGGGDGVHDVVGQQPAVRRLEARLHVRLQLHSRLLGPPEHEQARRAHPGRLPSLELARRDVARGEGVLERGLRAAVLRRLAHRHPHAAAQQVLPELSRA
mmetsp:Transcript_89396/g.268747  ORF Transcript_89396/g.268747 Transcript_89396/m.268747 type:complete len:308 (+) Transcript_89396:509-1432(+)